MSDNVSETIGSSDFDSSDEGSSVEFREVRVSDHIVLLANYHQLSKESKIRPESPRFEEREDTDPLRRRNIEKIEHCQSQGIVCDRFIMMHMWGSDRDLTRSTLSVIIIDDELPRAQNLWDVPADCREPSLWVRPHKVWCIPPGEFDLLQVVADFRELKPNLKGLTNQEMNKEPFINGLQYWKRRGSSCGTGSSMKILQDPRLSLDQSWNRLYVR